MLNNLDLRNKYKSYMFAVYKLTITDIKHLTGNPLTDTLLLWIYPQNIIPNMHKNYMQNVYDNIVYRSK